jgi:hypothetical protein
MKAKNIIFGSLALAVVGGGAYFYFKNKKKVPFSDTLGSALTNTSNSTNSGSSNTGSSNTGSGTTSTTPDKVLDTSPVTNAQAEANQQETAKQIQAQGLANQIVSLLATKKSTGGYPIDNSAISFNMVVDTKVLDIRNKMKDLGYKDDNGVAVKIK